jgi:hypothetical protein
MTLIGRGQTHSADIGARDAASFEVVAGGAVPRPPTADRTYISANPMEGYSLGPVNPISPKNLVLLMGATTRSLERFVGEKALARAPAAIQPLLRFLYQQAVTGEIRQGPGGKPPTTHSGTNILVSTVPGAIYDGKGPLTSPSSWNISKLPINASLGLNLEEVIRFSRSPAGQVAVRWLQANGGVGGRALGGQLRALAANDHTKSGVETWLGGRTRLGINLNLTPLVPGLADFGRFDRVFAGISPGIFAPLGGTLGSPKKPEQSPGFYWYVGARNGALAAANKPKGDPSVQGNAINVAFILSGDRNAALEGAVGAQLTLQFSRTRDGKVYLKVPDSEVYVQIPESQAAVARFILSNANAPGAILNQKPIAPPPASKVISFEKFTRDIAEGIAKAAASPIVQTAIRTANSEGGKATASVAQTAVSVQPLVNGAVNRLGLGTIAGGVAGGVATYVTNEVFNTAPTADLNRRTYPRDTISLSYQATPEYWRTMLSRRYGGNPIKGPHLREDQIAATANLASLAYRKLAGNLADDRQPPQRAETWIYEKAGGGVAGMIELLWTPFNQLPALDRNFNRQGVTSDSFRSIGMTGSESWLANDAYLRLRSGINPATRQNYSPPESYSVVLETYLYGKAWRGPVSGGEAALRILNQDLAGSRPAGNLSPGGGHGMPHERSRLRPLRIN